VAKVSYIFNEEIMSPHRSIKSLYEGGSASGINLIKCPESAIRDEREQTISSPLDCPTPIVNATSSPDLFAPTKAEDLIDFDYTLQVYDKYETNRIRW
jgi:hypothetical protein